MISGEECLPLPQPLQDRVPVPEDLVQAMQVILAASQLDVLCLLSNESRLTHQLQQVSVRMDFFVMARSFAARVSHVHSWSAGHA